MCVSFRCRYIRLEKLDKSSQDTLSLLSESLIQISLAAVLSEIGHLRLKSQLFRLRQPILLSAGGSKVSCSRFIQFLQAHTSTPERDATSLCSSGGVKTSTLSLRKVYIKSGIGGRRAGGRIFYKFTSKVLWSRRHLTSWKRLPLGSQIPRNLVPLRVSKQRKRACGEFIKILQPSVVH